MKKAAHALYLVGQIFSILGAVACIFAGAIIFATDGSNPNSDSAAKAVWLFVVAAFCIANTVFCSIGWKRVTLVSSILNIVGGVVSGVLFNALGGVFGLVYVLTHRGESEQKPE